MKLDDGHEGTIDIPTVGIKELESMMLNTPEAIKAFEDSENEFNPSEKSTK